MPDHQFKKNSNLEWALLTQQVRPQHLQFGICIIKLMIKYVSIKKSNRLVLSSSQNRNKLFPFAFHNGVKLFLSYLSDFHALAYCKILILRISIRQVTPTTAGAPAEEFLNIQNDVKLEFICLS